MSRIQHITVQFKSICGIFTQIDLLTSTSKIPFLAPPIYFLTSIGIYQRDSGSSFINTITRYFIRINGKFQSFSSDAPASETDDRNRCAHIDARHLTAGCSCSTSCTGSTAISIGTGCSALFTAAICSLLTFFAVFSCLSIFTGCSIRSICSIFTVQYRETVDRITVLVVPEVLAAHVDLHVIQIIASQGLSICLLRQFQLAFA